MINIDPKLSASTIAALNVAIPELIKQAEAMAAKTKLKSHRERLEATIGTFGSLQATIANQFAWSSTDYRTAYEALYLASQYVQVDGIDFDKAWDEVNTEMRRLEMKPRL